MKWLITLLFATSSILFFAGLFASILLSDKRMNRRMKRLMELNDSRKLSRKRFDVLVQLRLAKQAVRSKLSKREGETLEQLLRSSGLAMEPEEYVLFRWIAATLGGFLAVLLFGSWLWLPVGAIGGYLLPKWYVRKKVKDRIQRFNEGLEDTITTIIGSLRAGFSFAQALKTVTEEADPPIRDEMELVLKEMQYGVNMEEALLHLRDRMPSADLDLLVQAVLIQRQVGGNLAVVLETIVRTIRERNRIQRQVKTLTAQGRLSGMVIGLLPIGLAFVLYLIEPEYIGSLFRHPLGLAMVGAGGFSGAIGFMLIRKLTTIEV